MVISSTSLALIEVLQSLDLPFCLYDRQGIVQSVSSAMLEMFELEPIQQQQLNFFTYFQHQEEQQIWQTVLSGTSVRLAVADWKNEFWLVCLPDQQHILLHPRSNIGQDYEEDCWEALAGQNRYGIAVISQEGEILRANSAFEQLFSIFGLSSVYLNQLLDGEDLIVEQENRLKLLSGELANYQIDCRCNQRDQLLWMRLTVVPAGRSSLNLLVIAEDVQDQYEQQERLLSVERERRNLLLSRTLLLVQTTPQGEIALVSRAFQQKLGYSSEELCGSLISQWVHPLDLEELTRLMHQVDPWLLDCRWQTRQGSWLDLRLEGELTENFVMLNAVDISGYRALEARLQAKEGYYESLLLNLFGAFYRCNAFHEVQYISPGIEQIVGLQPFEIRHFSDFIHPDDQNEVDHAFTKATSVHYPYSLEYRVVTHEGVVRWISDQGRGSYDSQGKLQYVSGLIIDITDRKADQTLLLRQGQISESLMAALPDLIMGQTADGTLLSFYPALTFKSGVFNEYPGQNIADILPPHLAQLRLLHTRQALRTGQVQVYEHEIEVDGKLRSEEIRISPCGDEVVVIVRDITDQKELASTLQQHTASQFETLFEHLPVAVAAADKMGQTQAVNQAFLELFCLSSIQQKPQDLLSFIRPDNSEDNIFQQMTEGKIDRYSGKKLYYIDGNSLLVSVTIRVVPSDFWYVVLFEPTTAMSLTPD